MINEWRKQNQYKGTYMHPEDVYLDYPEGGQLGWWLICHETSSVWAWNIDTKKWENSSASAYEIAVKHGYKGSEPEWVEEFQKQAGEAKSAARKAEESSIKALTASDLALASADTVSDMVTRSNQAIKEAHAAVDRVDKELIKGIRFKGYFFNGSTLNREYPDPLPGDYAWVGEVYPGNIFRCDNAGEWGATNIVPEVPSVDMIEYAKKDNLWNKQDKPVEVLDSSLNVMPIEKEKVLSFFIDALLTGFDRGTTDSPRFYGPSGIDSLHKHITIYEVDKDGNFLDATKSLITCSIEKQFENVAFMKGVSNDGNKAAYFWVDWRYLSHRDAAVSGVRFMDFCYEPHYGALADYERISSVETSVNAKVDMNLYNENINELFRFGLKKKEVQSENITKMPEYVFWGGYDNFFLRMNRIGFWVTADRDFSADGIDLYIAPNFTGGNPEVGSPLPNINGGMFVTIGLRGKIVYSQDISPEWISSRLNNQVRPDTFNNGPTPPELYAYRIPIKLEFKEGDNLYIGYGTKVLSEYFTPFFFMDEPLDNTLYSEGLFRIQNDISVAPGVIPPKPADSMTGDSWYMCYDLYRQDYLKQKIENVVYGSEKDTLLLISPEVIYTVANNVDKSLFPKRQYSIPVYLDHCVDRSVNKELTAYFDETGEEKIMLYSPHPNDEQGGSSITGIREKTLMKKVIGGKDWKDTQVSFRHISTPETTGEDAVIRYLAIGDSVTSGYLSDNRNREGVASTYWSVVQEQFKKAQNENGEENKHRCVTLGTNSRDTYLVNGTTVNSYAEGYGGWCTADHAFYACSRSCDTDKQGVWDLLGLGDGTGSDWKASAAQKKLMHMTGEGFYQPKNTSAFCRYVNSRHDQSFTDYQQCVDFLRSYYEHPENPFFDYNRAGRVKFSVNKWLERYRTLQNNGVTRCDGGNKGSAVTDVTAYDVCLPSHITLGHSHNDGDKEYIHEVYRAWTDSIRAEYVANNWGKIFIGLHIIDFVGSYYPQKYASTLPITPLWETGTQGYTNYKRIVSEFANDEVNRIFILPSLFIAHPALSAPVRNADSPEHEIIDNEKFGYKIVNGGGPLWHPNALAHRCWGTEIYAWIRYTYSLN